MPLQVAVPFAGAVHLVPQVPQLLMSVCSGTHTPLQLVRPLPQFCAQVPLLHSTVPPDGAWHTLPHPPQWFTFWSMLISQPFTLLLSQSAYPFLQVV